ncbi:hypothetical protein [Agaribacterium haliotis]|uniref:hypothetical protein n=1 Tax=Agaribacterium haliotis TaxID=2013869 RepID=UPI000BB5459D|nr:hypothetical protein [Agaribacterium haliotis]
MNTQLSERLLSPTVLREWFTDLLTDDDIAEPLFIRTELSELYIFAHQYGAELRQGSNISDQFNDFVGDLTQAEYRIVALFAMGFEKDDPTVVALYNTCVEATDRYIREQLKPYGMDWLKPQVA